MCYVIVTSRTLLWTLLTIATTLSMLAAVITSSWLIGPPRHSSNKNYNYPSLGLYSWCTRRQEIDQLYINCSPFVTSFGMPSDEFPNFWKAALVFFALGLALMLLTILSSVLGCCVRSIIRKSIFTISGTVQAIAGLMFIFGLILYPAGWSSKRVQNMCGKSEPFVLGSCTLGWAFFLAVGSTLLTFVCSVLSIQAEISTSSDKVQDEILEGKTLICLF